MQRSDQFHCAYNINNAPNERVSTAPSVLVSTALHSLHSVATDVNKLLFTDKFPQCLPLLLPLPR